MIRWKLLPSSMGSGEDFVQGRGKRREACKQQRSLTSYHYLPIWEVALSQSETDKFSYSPTRMSTTPPKKGKKRAPHSTPTGRPPAKTRRASSPTPQN